MSGDGSVVVGQQNADQAYIWTQSSPFLLNLGALNNGNWSEAKAVSRDGSVVVGSAEDGAGTNIGINRRAFRWTQATGMVSLGTLHNGTYSYGYGVSADGSVVVGNAGDGASNNVQRAFRWTQATGMVSLGTLNNGNSTYTTFATGVSADGLIVVGYAPDGAAFNHNRAFRWTQATGMVSLGTLNNSIVSNAYAVNADGSVVVGSSTYGNGSSQRAFRWTQATGMISVDQWLRNSGVTLPNDVTEEARGVSADGNVVVGVRDNGHGFVARGATTVATSGGTTPPAATTTTPPAATTTTTAGLMDVTNYQQSLASKPRVTTLVQGADSVMNGAHSSPLFMLLDAGQSSAWFIGDAGYATTSTSKGGIGSGEFGFGRGLDDGWNVRVAGGGQYSQLDLSNGGNAVFSSGYIAPEVSHSFDNTLVATLSGYFAWGKADLRRGYLNGAANDSSFGTTATQTAGVRARVDWQNAFSVDSTSVSPFASYTFVNSQMDGYTETGGSFPARFDASRENSNTVRIGADARTPLNEHLALVTRLEYGHRFEKAGAGSSGQILGLTAFSMDGAATQQDFARGGIGIDYKIGNGDGLVMLNTSNQTGRNVTWLSASYRVKF